MRDWDEDEPAVSVKVDRKYYPIRRDLHSKRSYVLSCHRALLQITSRTADGGGVSEVLAGRMLCRHLCQDFQPRSRLDNRIVHIALLLY
jgi:hypothetical protein